VGSGRRGLLLLALFWGLLRVITVAQRRIVSAAWLGGQEAEARTLVPLLGNILRVVVGTAALLAALAFAPAPVTVVSIEVGWGIVPENALARAFRDAQGRLNQQIAAQAGLVIGVMAGLPVVLKGDRPAWL